MPAVIPIAVYFGASAATAATIGTAVTVAATVGSVAATGYSMYAQNKAAKNAAGVSTSIADYNARQDEALAAQLDLDTQQNIKTERAENAGYVSKLEASYASAGVLSNSGSALDAQLTTVGRMEQQIQQQWVNMNQQKQQYAASGMVGRLEGKAQAESFKAQGRIAVINGAANISRSLFGAYQSGVFSGLGSASTGAIA